MLIEYKYKLRMSEEPIQEKDVLDCIEKNLNIIELFIPWKIYQELKDRTFVSTRIHELIRSVSRNVFNYRIDNSIEFKIFTLEYLDKIYNTCKYLKFDNIPLNIIRWCKIVFKLNEYLNNTSNYYNDLISYE